LRPSMRRPERQANKGQHDHRHHPPRPRRRARRCPR
jgi:hypothetical protein